jgi:hypothetical protein
VISREDAGRIRWLEAFGGLTANTDRHDGNLSFLRDARGKLTLAPVYDPAPMGLAPVAAGVLDHAWQPEAPLPTAITEWRADVCAARPRSSARRALARGGSMTHHNSLQRECSRAGRSSASRARAPARRLG